MLKTVMLEELSADNPTHFSLVMNASRDSVITDNATVPANAGEDKIFLWMLSKFDDCWVIRVDDDYAGLLMLNREFIVPGVEQPSATTETWLIEKYRGQGLASKAWRNIIPQLDVKVLVALVKENNTSSNARVAKDGYVFWRKAETDDGDYNVWTLKLL